MNRSTIIIAVGLVIVGAIAYAGYSIMKNKKDGKNE